MLATLISMATTLWCPLCEAAAEQEAVTQIAIEAPNEPGAGPVRLLGATEGGDMLTLSVYPDGTVEKGDPTPIVRPEGHDGRVTSLSTHRYEPWPRASVEVAFGYDHDAEVLFTFEKDGDTAINLNKVPSTGWHRGRGMTVNALGTVFFVNGERRTIEVLGSAQHALPLARVDGLSIIEAISFADDGTLYAVGNTEGEFSRALYSISLHDGSATEVVKLDVSDLDALAWASDGMLYATDANGREAHLYRIDPGAGTWEDLGGVGVIGITALTEKPRDIEVGADDQAWEPVLTETGAESGG